MEQRHNKISEELTEIKIKHKTLSEEHYRLRMRLRNLKLKYRRFGDQEKKMCKNCGKEFVESENFNWSCRINKSQWSGLLYWCCGKNYETALGCKFSKHENKEEEAGDQEGEET